MNESPLPETMRAALYDQQGAYDAVYVGDIPRPVPGAQEVLLRVRAASLNGFDPMMLNGSTQLRTPLPMIPLGDCAGEIAALGAGVTGWSVGDRVCPHPFVAGEGMTGETRRGVAAEFAVFPAANLLRMPDSVSFAAAACLPIAYGTAHRMMLTRGAIQAGEKVLILGATGGVGICALELAKSAGCEVIATGSADWKLAKLREIGADHVVNTETEDFEEAVRTLFGKPKMQGGGGVDVVVNYIGGDTWVKSIRCLGRGGRLLTCGATAGYEPAEDIRYLWTYELNLLGANGFTPTDIEALLAMVAEQQLSPHIQQVGGLVEVGPFIRQLADREVFGKLVIEP
ncbi:MAG: zinc-binding dehydrogenase [Pseudomonadota bacterium]